MNCATHNQNKLEFYCKLCCEALCTNCIQEKKCKSSKYNYKSTNESHNNNHLIITKEQALNKRRNEVKRLFPFEQLKEELEYSKVMLENKILECDYSIRKLNSILESDKFSESLNFVKI